jgi:hypothetical protein
MYFHVRVPFQIIDRHDLPKGTTEVDLSKHFMRKASKKLKWAAFWLDSKNLVKVT